jgi:uncharacterized protein (PEP-CTERM system associated)
MVRITKVLFCYLVTINTVALAADVSVNAGLSAELVDQQIKTKESPKQTIDATNIIVRPFASLQYQTKSLNFFLKGTNNNIRKKLDNETITQNFAEYSYSGSYDIVENLLLLSAYGSSRYSSNSLNSFLVDDFLLNSDSLNKIESDSASLALNVRRGKFYGLSSTTSYTHINSRLNNTLSPDDTVFESENYGFTFEAVTGENLDGARISLSSVMQYSKRGFGQDFISQQIGLAGDFEVYGDFGISVNANYENNEFKQDVETVNNGLREFYSYGAGIIWQPRSDRYLKVLLNNSVTSSLIDGEQDEEDTFLSYNVNWAFSQRTSLQGSFTRRFFGNAGNLSFNHRLKNWRSSINYTEVVSSNSRLINSNNVGLFICENGSTDIADCRLSDTLEPDLGQGEVLQPFVIQNPIINDRIVIRKSLTALAAVTRRRTTLSLTASRSENEEVEVNSILSTSVIRASLDFSLGNNTKLQYSYSFANSEFERDGDLEDAITKRHNIEFRRQLTSKFTAALGLSHLDRNGEISRGTQSLRGLSGPLTDRRLTFRISYDLGSN